MNILLVEDDSLIRAALGLTLTDEGFHVIEAATAEEAMEVVDADGPPAVLVTDLKLGPGMNGLELIAAVRQRWPATCAILTSGVDTVPGLHPSDRLLPKPYHLGDVVSMVRRTMSTQDDTTAQQ